MRGEVEIYSNGKLLHRESNLIVNGAGVLLADIMTVSPSLSAIAVDNLDTATSAILDSSNYTVQAISFGTAAKAYQQNAHTYAENKATLLSATFGPDAAGHSSSVIAVVQQPKPGVTTPSSYSPIDLLPHYSDPTLTSLELSSDVSASVSGVALSSLVPGNGQNLNLIPSAYHQAVFSGTVLSSLSSVGASLIGCWAAGSSTKSWAGFVGTGFSGFTPGTNSYDHPDIVYSGVYNGLFNEASSMDTSGFVNMIMSGCPGTRGVEHYEMSSTASGLCISGGTNLPGVSQYSNSGVVEYSVTIGSGDMGAANLYGGIYNMGLWTIDMEKSLLAGNTPPYAFDPLNNPRRYRLFATKSFSQNLCQILDTGSPGGAISHLDLLVKWRLHFI